MGIFPVPEVNYAVQKIDHLERKHVNRRNQQQQQQQQQLVRPDRNEKYCDKYEIILKMIRLWILK
jgi:hypothetical protein